MQSTQNSLPTVHGTAASAPEKTYKVGDACSAGTDSHGGANVAKLAAAWRRQVAGEAIALMMRSVAGDGMVARSRLALVAIGTLRSMIQIQLTQHVFKRSGRFRRSPLHLSAVLRFFQMIQDQLRDELTLADAADAAVVVDFPCKGRVDLDTEVYQWHCAASGRLTSRVNYS